MVKDPAFDSDSVEGSKPTTESIDQAAHCHVCREALRPVFPQGEDAEAGAADCEAIANEQWDNALVITFEGGYSMFIDPIEPDQPDPSTGLLGNYKIVICHDCAHQLCSQNPWLEALIQPLYSHAHAHGQDWSQHAGWDLPHDCSVCGARLAYGEDNTKFCPQASAC